MDVEHRIFTSTSARMAALGRDASDLLRQGCGVMVTTHFSTDLPAVEQALSAAGVAATICATPFDLQGVAEALAGEAPIAALALARLLSPRLLAGIRRPTGRQWVWIVTEHHPTVAGDDAILECARTFSGRSMVRFYDSLDSAFFLRFGGDQVRQLWAGLSLEQNEYVSHDMIARTIRNAQVRIARQAKSSFDAASAEAWFQQNLP